MAAPVRKSAFSSSSERGVAGSAGCAGGGVGPLDAGDDLVGVVGDREPAGAVVEHLGVGADALAGSTASGRLVGIGGEQSPAQPLAEQGARLHLSRYAEHMF